MRESFSMCLPPWEGGEDDCWQLEDFFFNLQLYLGFQRVHLEQQFSSCRRYRNLVLSEDLFVLRFGCELMICFRGFSGLPSW